MSDWIDEDGNNWTNPAARAVGNPITDNQANLLTENERVTKSSKAGALPGSNADCVDMLNESGGTINFWLIIEDGDTEDAANFVSYGGALTESFVDDGWKNRILDIHVWFTHVATSGAADNCRPGESNDYTVFTLGKTYTGEGWHRSFYPSHGGDGTGNYRCKFDYTTGVTTYSLIFFVTGTGANEGKLRCKFERAGAGDDFVVVAGFAHFSPFTTKYKD